MKMYRLEQAHRCAKQANWPRDDAGAGAGLDGLDGTLSRIYIETECEYVYLQLRERLADVASARCRIHMQYTARKKLQKLELEI